MVNQLLLNCPAARTIPRFATLVRVKFGTRELHTARIVRAFPRNGDVMDVAFAQARAGDAHELRLLMELCKVSGADISHRGADATRKLLRDDGYSACLRYLA